MTTPRAAHRAQGTPRLLRTLATRTTTNVVVTAIGSLAFVAFGLALLLATESFVGRRFRFLFIQFTADYTFVTIAGAVAVLFFGFGVVLCVWELVRRKR